MTESSKPPPLPFIQELLEATVMINATITCCAKNYKYCSTEYSSWNVEIYYDDVLHMYKWDWLPKQIEPTNTSDIYAQDNYKYYGRIRNINGSFIQN
jgi:hypothetical protein